LLGTQTFKFKIMIWKIVLWCVLVYIFIALVIGVMTNDYKKGFLWIAYLFDDIDFPDDGIDFDFD